MTDPLDMDGLRRTAQNRRQSPALPVQIVATFADGYRITDTAPADAVELLVEPTNANGAFAQWLDDAWWTAIIQRWADDPVTVHIAPTFSALCHPIVLHQIEMIRRVVPGWRTIGHVYRTDLATDDCVAAVASSPYHEVRFIDARRPGILRTGRIDTDQPLEVLFRRIRNEQNRTGATTPILTRVPASRSTIVTGLSGSLDTGIAGDRAPGKVPSHN